MTIGICNGRPLHLFDGFGVELEYMIVDRNSLDVLPAADRLLSSAAGIITNEHPRGNGTAWSNELALHLVEFKTDGPVCCLAECGAAFQAEVNHADSLLASFGGQLMPGSMHPWMNPERELRLWPHGYNPIYEAFDRTFNCRRHGWANLQSAHLNLPFSGDEEFERLHAAVRLVLPLIPAMAASSPIADGAVTPWLCYRMETYRTNSQIIPSVTGLVIPEAVFNRRDYHHTILAPMYRDIAPYDPEGILQEEWLNSRGAMSRWDRNAIEIRVTDMQEHPAADLAIAEWITALTRQLVSETWCSLDDQKSWSHERLNAIFLETIKHGERAEISDRDYASLFGLNPQRITAGALCKKISHEMFHEKNISQGAQNLLEIVIEEGPLARRIQQALPTRLNHRNLHSVFETLCYHLHHGKSFIP